jgi:hypothetical protein
MRSTRSGLFFTGTLLVLAAFTSAAVSPIHSRHLLQDDEPVINAGATTTTSGSGGGAGGGSLGIGTVASSDVLDSGNPLTGVITKEANAYTGGDVDVYADGTSTESDSISNSNILPALGETPPADATIRVESSGDASGEVFAGSEAGTSATFVEGPTVSFSSGEPEIVGVFGSSLAAGIAAAAAGEDSEATTDIQTTIDMMAVFENSDSEGFALSEADGMGSTGGYGEGSSGSSTHSTLDLTADVSAVADTTVDNFFVMSEEAIAGAEVNGHGKTDAYANGFTTSGTQLDGETYSYATDAYQEGVGTGGLNAHPEAKARGDAHVYSLGKSLYGMAGGAKSGASLESIAGAEATFDFSQNPLPGIATVQGGAASHGGGMAYGYAEGNLFEKSYSDVHGETEAHSEASILEPAISGASGSSMTTVDGDALGTDLLNLYSPLVFTNAEGLAVSSTDSQAGVNEGLGQFSSGGSADGNGYVSVTGAGLYSETQSDVETAAGESSLTYAQLAGLGVGAMGGGGGDVDTTAISKGIGLSKSYADGYVSGQGASSGAMNPITGAFIAASDGSVELAGDTNARGNLFTYTDANGGNSGAGSSASAVDLSGTPLGAGGLGATATGGFTFFDDLATEAYGSNRGYAASNIEAGLYSVSDALALASVYEIDPQSRRNSGLLVGDAYTGSMTSNYGYGDASSVGRYKSAEIDLVTGAETNSISGSASLQEVTSDDGRLFASGIGAGSGFAAGGADGTITASASDGSMPYTSVAVDLGADVSSGLDTLSGSSNTATSRDRRGGGSGSGRAAAFGSNEIFGYGTGQSYGSADTVGQQSHTDLELGGGGETFVVGGSAAYVEFDNGDFANSVLSLGIADGEGMGLAHIDAEAYGPSTSVAGAAGGSGYAGSESLGDSSIRVFENRRGGVRLNEDGESDASGYGKGFSGASAITHGEDTTINGGSWVIGNTEGGAAAYNPDFVCIEDGKDACVTTFTADAESDSYLGIAGENAAGYLGDSAISVGASPRVSPVNAHSIANGISEGTFEGDGYLDADTYTDSEAVVSSQGIGVPGGNEYVYVTSDGLLVAGFANAEGLETFDFGFGSNMEVDERDGSALAEAFALQFGQLAAVGAGLSAVQVADPSVGFNGGGGFVGGAANALGLVDAKASIEPSGSEERLLALTRGGATDLGITVGDDTMVSASADANVIVDGGASIEDNVVEANALVFGQGPFTTVSVAAGDNEAMAYVPDL